MDLIPTKIKSLLFEEVQSIKQKVYHEVINSGENAYWKTVQFSENGSSEKESIDIYSGVAGIIHFLLMILYLEKNDPHTLELIRKACNWLIENTNDQIKDQGFYTGKMGVAYTLCLCSKELNDPKIRESGLKIARECSIAIRSESKAELLSGLSGILLGYLLIYEHTKDGSVIPYAKDCIDVIIKKARIGQEGIFWDKSPENIQPLCGLAHGNCGIGYALAQAGVFFQSDGLLWLASQAFDYENYFFDNNNFNWPDFRKSPYDNKEQIKVFEKAIRENDLKFFYTPHFMNAWCHGAIGIGLSRLASEDLYNNYKNDVEKASKLCDKTLIDNKIENCTVCHAVGGHITFFLEKWRKTSNLEDFSKAVNLMLNGVSFKRLSGVYKHGFSTLRLIQEDLSLFNGIAGIGYIICEIILQSKKSGIFIPQVDCIYKKHLSLSIETIKKQILTTYFPASINLLEKHEIYSYSKWNFQIINTSILELIPRLKNVKESHLMNFEFLKMKLFHKFDNESYFFNLIKQRQKRTQRLTKTDVSKKTFVISDHVIVFDFPIGFHEDSKAEYILLEYTFKEVLEHQLTEVSYRILHSFIEAISYGQLLDSLIRTFDITNKNEEVEIKNFVENQIYLFLMSGYITIIDSK